MSVIFVSTQCVSSTWVDKVIVDPDNGLLHAQHQGIIWTNVGLLLIGPLGTTSNEIWIKIQQFSLEENAFKNADSCCALPRLINFW